MNVPRIGALAACIGLLVPVTACTAGQDTSGESPTSNAPSSLTFPVDSYTEETETITTSDAEVEVTYRLYSEIPYVTNPVSTEYQSLSVKVPVSIDGEPVEAADAPMLLNIQVGGYLSTTADGQSPMGGGSGGPRGGQVPPSGAPLPGEGGTDTAGQLPSGNMDQRAFEGQSGSGNAELALAAGYVVVTPGVRGRDNQSDDGTYFGKAPAAIVDLKAAVRYLHYNSDLIPGNADHIISSGTSAGGALSTLLGASIGSDLYDADLDSLGAAQASDAIFAVASYCPITDLENANGAYEFAFGRSALNGSPVDQTASAELASTFAEYETSLSLDGVNGFGTVTGDNLSEYLLEFLLQPSATAYLANLSAADRDTYLAENPWITWQDGVATFTWADFQDHVGRSKGLGAFDAPDLTAGENGLFGTETVDARHFTTWGLQNDTGGDTRTALDAADTKTVAMMNPMPFLLDGNSDRATHWFFRTGTSDTDTSPSILANLATATQNLGDDVNVAMYWDAGHGANQDAADFVAWIASITGSDS